MINFVPPYIQYFIGAAIAALISMYAVRKILFITSNRKIYDTPDDTRKFHGAQIPSLGGIGIFIGYVVVSLFFWQKHHFFMPYLLASSVILFFTGIYDDLMNMRPSKKMVAQLIASVITVFVADIRLESLYGLFGIWALPYWASVFITTIACTFFINVFNFIDGIDGLACIIAILYLGILGALYVSIQHFFIAGILFSLMGATFGLLVYNVAPARIYMGDTGSMLLGFSIFAFYVLFIKMFAEDNGSRITTLIHSNQAAVIIVLSILFLPVYDALRVFIVRMSRGISPLKADRSHLHYYLLDAGFSHSQSVWIILVANILMITVAYLLQDKNPLLVLSCITALATLLLWIVYILRQKKRVLNARQLPGNGLLPH